MYVVTSAHALTVIVIVGAIMLTPVYVLSAYVFSGAFLGPHAIFFHPLSVLSYLRYDAGRFGAFERKSA